MRIGLAQMDICWENIEKNKEKAEAFFEKAKDNYVDILVFPEMTLTGFSMNVEKTGENWEEQARFFQENSKKYHITAVFGYTKPISSEKLEKHPEWKKYHNCLGIAQDGELILNYAKIHPFSYGMEGEYFQGGNHIFCAGWQDTTLGAFVCYDLRFPEIFQTSSVKSEVIFVIANWPDSRIGQWDILLQARAVENQCFIVGVNRTGEGGNLTYNGHSVIFGPGGERLTQLNEGESLLIGDVDTSQIKKIRERFPVKKDRREGFYKKMILE